MSNTTNQTKRQGSRKVAAILAGGLVLGVGTMATLASWNDSEYANATFTAGRFNLQGSLTGAAGSFSDHATTPGAALSFSAPFSNLQPDSVTFAAYAVQLTADTTNDATVSISATSQDAVTGLTYQLVKVPSITCSQSAIDAAAATAANVLVPAGTAVGSAAGATTFDLAKAAGSTAFLCFKVSANSGLVQGQSGTGVWQFTATSKAN